MKEIWLGYGLEAIFCVGKERREGSYEWRERCWRGGEILLIDVSISYVEYNSIFLLSVNNQSLFISTHQFIFD
jgi:hypothetical protein